tara:strand:- start:778 stop:1002 length:225 start_codon:yes stop_codon:yes gene_type:complete
MAVPDQTHGTAAYPIWTIPGRRIQSGWMTHGQDHPEWMIGKTEYPGKPKFCSVGYSLKPGTDDAINTINLHFDA